MGFWKKTPDFTLEEMRVIRLYSHTVATTERERLRQINVALREVSESTKEIGKKTKEAVERHEQELERLRREIDRLEKDRIHFDDFDMTAGAVRVLPFTVTREQRKWKIKRK